MKTRFGFIAIFLILLGIASCSERTKVEISPLGDMHEPAENPSTQSKIELGKKLFFDKRLSLNNTISCASCHVPSRAFTDGKQLGEGVEKRQAFRNTPSILNAGFLPKLMYDGEISSLEEQVLVPILDHDEMGASMPEIIEKLQKDKDYQNSAQKIFNRSFDAWVLTRSIAAYERSLISDDSPFDQFYFGNKENAITESARRGWKLFSDELKCTTCHPAPFFTDFKVHNNGKTHLNELDLGRYRITNDSLDIGYFKTPSLRNVEITGPYMHDGSKKSILEVIDYYQNGGSNGVNQEDVIKPFVLSADEKRDLIHFLKSLTDGKYKE